MSSYSAPRRFLKLRACWVILRGGSVGYRINATADGITPLPGNMALFVGCQVDGQPAGLWNIYRKNPRPQPDEPGEKP